MIQEVVGGVVEDRKTPNSNNNSPTNSSSESLQLRCPRCDSANTKFCYYNNYNLTQPRHFCKTCRRYWTKGGALRNVPIGGGCRKTKAAASAIIPGAVKSRITSTSSSSSRAVGPTDSILWGGCTAPGVVPHMSSHLLALLRASQQAPHYYPPPPQHDIIYNNPILHSILIKEEEEEAGPMVVGPHDGPGSVDPFVNVGTQQYHDQYLQLQQQNHNLFQLGDVPTTSGIQELYQRLRGSGNDQNLITMGSGNVDNNNNSAGSSFSAAATATAATSTATTASFLETMMPLSGGDFAGYWNPGMAWADISLPNGAIFP